MIRITLLASSLMLLWVFTGPSGAQPKDPVLPEGGWPRHVTGLGTTVERAKEIAVKEAVKEVVGLMKKHELTSFVPTEEYVTANLLDGPGKAGKGQEIKLLPGDENLQLKEWIVAFRSDSNWWKEIVRRDQEAQRGMLAAERQSYMTRFMAGIGVVLLSGFGYLQLDRYTNYRYTTWLRVAGVGVVSFALAAFWWIVHISG